MDSPTRKAAVMMIAYSRSAGRLQNSYMPLVDLAADCPLAHRISWAAGLALPLALVLVAYHPLQGAGALAVLGAVAAVSRHVLRAGAKMFTYQRAASTWYVLGMGIADLEPLQDVSRFVLDAQSIMAKFPQPHPEDLLYAENAVPE